MRETSSLITAPTVKPTLEVVRHQFDAWRKRRRCRGRIPEALWEAAVGLCREHSMCEVSRSLRVNYNGLKNRILKGRDMGLAIGKRSDLGFVKLDLGAPIVPSECLVEMEAPNGAKMRMSFRGTAREFDLVELGRAFWRQGWFFAARGAVPHGLDSQIDTPRVYRQEQLPRALPWTTVEAFLRSIDRNTVMGKRDYAMFSLMTIYGLRACDVVALKLDDIKWRSGSIRICQTKTGNPLELPLTHEVSSALYDYLKRVPRYGNYREVFLRLRAPGGTLKPTALTEAFQVWSRKSGLGIPFQGTYCLRHSYALHLFHHGLPLKTIGDLLGHRSPESTGVYIRLVTEDLREVPLHVPAFVERQEEVES